MQRLTVLTVGFPLAAAGPDAVGGVEQVVAQLDAALIEAGHRSVVLAPAGSRLRGELWPLPAPPERLEHEDWVRAHEALRPALSRAIAALRPDLVHLHGVDFDCYLPPPGPPALVTLHLAPGAYRPAALHPARALTFLQPVSRAQRTAFPAGVALLDPIENGVALDAYRPALRRRRYALVLARIAEPKGQDLAIAAARRAGVPLVLAGAVHPFPEHLRFFERAVRPQLDAPGTPVRWAGPVAGVRKRRLLAGARCLVVPSRAAETASLAAMEALASGVPVVGFRRGALPDLVEEGRTGYLVDTVDELAGAIQAAAGLRSEDCRGAAEARCGLDRTARTYLALYARLARLPRPAPAATPDVAGAGPLPGPPGPRGGLRVEVLRSFERLEALAGPWSDLWQRAVAATPFGHPAWLLPWCRHLAGAPPLALAAWRGRDLAALLPAFVYPHGGARVLGLLGGAVSDYQDLLADGPDAAGAVLAALGGLRAAGRENGFDHADLEALPAGSALRAAAVPPELAAQLAEQDVCPTLPLNAPGPDLGGRLSAKMLDDVAWRRRRLLRAGALELEVAGREALPGVLADLFRLHRRRWEARGAPGVLDDARLRRFHGEAAPALQRAGILRLLATRISGATAAVLYAMVAQGRAYAYLSGLDPAAARASPGTMLFLRLIEDAAAEGCVELDLLRGREAYKYRFGAEDRPTYRLALTPAGEAAGSGATFP